MNNLEKYAFMLSNTLSMKLCSVFGSTKVFA